MTDTAQDPQTPGKLHPLNEQATEKLDSALLAAAQGLTDPAKLQEAENIIAELDPALLPDIMIALLAYSSGAATNMTASGMKLEADITEEEQHQINNAAKKAETLGQDPIAAAMAAEEQVHETRLARFHHHMQVVLTINAMAAAILKHHTEAAGGWRAVVTNTTRTLNRLSDVLVARYIKDQNQKDEEPADQTSALPGNPG